MTFEELHKILDDENKKITLQEYQDVLCELKLDVFHELCNKSKDDYQWYMGESNGFQLALDLSEHLNDLEQAYTNLCKYVEENYGESCVELYERFLDGANNV